MPQILVLTDSQQSSGEIVYRERVARSCLESEHFSHQLLERVNWAVEDADAREHDAKVHEPAHLRAVPAASEPEPQPAWHPAVR
jgi:hypothetical protein